MISIIALLSSVVLASVNSARQKAQMAKVNSSLEEFVKALEVYRTTYGHYPSSSSCTSGECDLNFSFDGSLPSDNALTLQIIGELKLQKIYSGDLLSVLKAIPDMGLFSVYYYSPVSFTADDGIDCGGKRALNEYYLNVTIRGKQGEPLALNNSYLSKELQAPNYVWDQSYCAGN